MSNEVAKPKDAQALDGFAGYESGIEGKDVQLQSDRSLAGLKLKFLNGVWLDSDEQEVKAELVALDVQRKVQKWLTDSGPAETVVLMPGAKFPDIEAMNAECPESEWREKFGTSSCSSIPRRWSATGGRPRSPPSAAPWPCEIWSRR